MASRLFRIGIRLPFSKSRTVLSDTFARFANSSCDQAESYFSRLRRAELGQNHRISGKYLAAYAVEMAWREDTRRRPNGTLHALAAGAALGPPVSRMWKGYWLRAARA
jgi:hypothetical protein